MDRKLIWLGAIVGSTAGGFLPMLWHASAVSLASMGLSTVGGVAGIWFGYRLSR